MPAPRQEEPAAVVVSARGAARLRDGHPWVYRSDVLRAPPLACFAPIEDRRGRRLGWAAVNPRSEITVRRLHAHDTPVDTAVLMGAIDTALLLRRELAERPTSGLAEDEALRLVHGDADALPGLVVDRYGPILVLQSGSAPFEEHLPAIAAHLVERTGAGGLLARLDAPVRTLEGLPRLVLPLVGTVPETVEVRLGPAVVPIDPWRGQKTGAFLDQRLNQRRLASYARGRALDVFSYQGGFALQMALGSEGAPGAETLELVDSSAPALELARRALQLNGVRHARTTVADAFGRLRALDDERARFELVNLDPPALAKRQRDRDRAFFAYKELNLRALRLLAPGGVLGTSSCSFHVSDDDFLAMLEQAAADAGRSCRVLGRFGAAPDHPERLGFPESRYLTFVMLQALD